MARQVIPVRSLSMRLPEAGRIRIGTSEKAKSRKGTEFDRPVKLDRFRFTSADPSALQQVAAIYGGEVKPWSHQRAAKGQFELITDAREIRVALPPDPLGGTPIYEKWEGGGCERRCDGETCEVIVSGPDGPEPQQTPCMCAAKGALECKVTTHLSVLLPEIRFVGVWRLTTHGWNAAQELPGMVDLIRSLQDRGIIRGVLRVEARHTVTGGQSRDFMVPVLGVDESVEALAAGSARLGALDSGQAPAFGELGAGEIEGGAEPPHKTGDVQQQPGDAPVIVGGPDTRADGTEAPPSTIDDDVIDAEIVDDDTDPAATLIVAASSAAKKNKALKAARLWAEHKGMRLPLTFDEVTQEPVLAAHALEAIS